MGEYPNRSLAIALSPLVLIGNGIALLLTVAILYTVLVKHVNYRYLLAPTELSEPDW